MFNIDKNFKNNGDVDMNNKLKIMELVSTDLLNKISGGVDFYANNSSHYRMPTISGYANMAPQGQVNYNVTVTVPIPYVDHVSAMASFQGVNKDVQSAGVGIGFEMGF